MNNLWTSVRYKGHPGGAYPVKTGLARHVVPLPAGYLLPGPTRVDCAESQFLVQEDTPAEWCCFAATTGSFDLQGSAQTSTKGCYSPESLTVGIYTDGTRTFQVAEDLWFGNVTNLTVVRGDTLATVTVPVTWNASWQRGYISNATLLSGGLSQARGDTLTTVTGAQGEPSFWWTRNDTERTRFTLRGGFHTPLLGTAPINLGYPGDASVSLTPVPPDTVGSLIQSIKVGSSFLVPGGTFQGCFTMADASAESYGWATQYHAVVGLPSGTLLWNPLYRPSQEAFYYPEVFDQSFSGDLGVIDTTDFLLAPIPDPNEYPLLTLGTSPFLTVQVVSLDTDLDALTLVSSQAGVSLESGRVRISQEDVDLCSTPAFLNAHLWYRGVSLTSTPSIADTPTTLVDQTGALGTGDQEQLFLRDSVVTPTGFTSGIRLVPDGTGRNHQAGTPKTRPGTTGLVRAHDTDNPVVYAEGWVAKVVHQVRLNSDVPLKILPGHVWIALEKGAQGSRVFLSPSDKLLLKGLALNYCNPCVRLSSNQASQLVSRKSFKQDLVLTQNITLPIRRAATNYSWTIVAGTYSAQDLADSFNTLTGTTNAKVIRNHLVLVHSNLEIGFSTVETHKALGFLPGWTSGTTYEAGIRVDLKVDEFHPHVRVTSFRTDAVIGTAGTFTTQLLSAVPQQGLPGYSREVLFKAIKGLDSTLLRPYQEIQHVFEARHFKYLKWQTTVQSVTQKTRSLAIPPGVVQDSISLYGYLDVAPDGGAYQSVSAFDSYPALVPLQATAQSVATGVNATWSGQDIQDPAVTNWATIGAQVEGIIQMGASCGVITNVAGAVLQVNAPNTLEGSWELFGHGGLVASNSWITRALPDANWRTRVWTPLSGLITLPVSANTTLSVSGQEITPVFLTTTSLGTLSNSLVIPTDRIPTEGFSLVVGSQLELTHGASTLVPVPALGTPALGTCQYDPAGAVAFATDLLATLEGAEVLYRQRFGTTLAVAGSAWIDPVSGEYLVSSLDVYAVEPVASRVNPVVGIFSLPVPLVSGQQVQVRTSTGESFVSLTTQRETATPTAEPNQYSFATGKTVTTINQVFVDGVPSNFTGASAQKILSLVPAKSGVVEVSYNTLAAQGGEYVIPLQESVQMDRFRVDKGVTSFRVPGIHSDLVTGAIIRQEGILLQIASTVVGVDTTVVLTTPTPQELGSRLSNVEDSLEFTAAPLNWSPLVTPVQYRLQGLEVILAQEAGLKAGHFLKCGDDLYEIASTNGLTLTLSAPLRNLSAAWQCSLDQVIPVGSYQVSLQGPVSETKPTQIFLFNSGTQVGVVQDAVVNPETGDVILSSAWEADSILYASWYSPVDLEAPSRYRLKAAYEGMTDALLGSEILGQYHWYSPDVYRFALVDPATAVIETPPQTEPFPAVLTTATPDLQGDVYPPQDALYRDQVALARLSDAQQVCGALEGILRVLGKDSSESPYSLYLQAGTTTGTLDTAVSQENPYYPYIQVFNQQSGLWMIPEDALVDPTTAVVVGEVLSGTAVTAQVLSGLRSAQVGLSFHDTEDLWKTSNTLLWASGYQPSQYSTFYPTQRGATGVLLTDPLKGDSVGTTESSVYGDLTGTLLSVQESYPKAQVMRYYPDGVGAITTPCCVASPDPLAFPWYPDQISVDTTQLDVSGGPIPDLYSCGFVLGEQLAVIRAGVSYRLVSHRGFYDSEGTPLFYPVYIDAIFSASIVTFTDINGTVTNSEWLFLTLDGNEGIPAQLTSADILSMTSQTLPQGDAPSPQTTAWKTAVADSSVDLMDDLTLRGTSLIFAGTNKTIQGEFSAVVEVSPAETTPVKTPRMEGTQDSLPCFRGEPEFLSHAFDQAASLIVNTATEVPVVVQVRGTASGAEPPATFLTPTALPTMSAGAVLLVETDVTNEGWQGWQEVSAVETTGAKTSLSVPRFVTPSKQGQKCCYTLKNSAVVSGVVVTDSGVVTTLDFSATSLVLNDGSVFATGGYNRLVNGGAIPYPNSNTITFRLYNTTTGLLVETLVVQGNSLTGGVGAVVLGSAPQFWLDSVTLNATGALANPGTYQVGISLDTTVSGSYGAYVMDDRIRFQEQIDLRYAQPRWAVNVGGVSIETQLNCISVEGAAGTLSVNDAAEVNGGDPFTFLDRQGGFGEWTPKVGLVEEEGTLRVCSVEGWLNNPVVQQDIQARALPVDSVASGTGQIGSDQYSLSRMKNLVFATGNISLVQPGDFLQVLSDSTNKATVKAGMSVVRHVVVPTVGNTRPTRLRATTGSATGWARVRYPVALSYAAGTLEVDAVPTHKNSADLDIYSFGLAGTLYLILDIGALRTPAVASRVDAAVLLVDYTGLTATQFTGLNNFRDADGLAITPTVFQDAIRDQQCLVGGHKYVGINWGGIKGLPDNQVVAAQTGVAGFTNLRFSHPNAASHDFVVGDLVLGVPGANHIGISLATKVADTGQCPPVGSAIYDNVPRYLDVQSIGAAQWNALYGINKVGYRCLLPGTMLETWDGASNCFFPETGIFLEPSHPRSCQDLSSFPAHVSDVSHTAGTVGLRDPAAFGGAAGIETVLFSVKRARRFQTDQWHADLNALGKIYLIPTGAVTALTQGAFYQTVQGVTQFGDFVEAEVQAGDWLMLDSTLTRIVGVSASTLTVLSTVLTTATTFQVLRRISTMEQAFQTLMEQAFTLVLGGTQASVATTNYLSDAGVSDFALAGCVAGDYLVVDPIGSLSAREWGAGPQGDTSISPRAEFAAGSASPLDDNRGHYRVLSAGATLHVNPVHTYAGTEASPVVQGTTLYPTALYPTVLNEGQNDLRVTAPAVGGLYSSTPESVETFSFRVYRSTGKMDEATLDFLLTARVVFLNWIDQLAGWLDTAQGTYRAFQENAQASDVNAPRGASPTDMDLDGFLGLSAVFPFASGPQMGSALATRSWNKDKSLQYTPAAGPVFYADNLTENLPDRINAQWVQLYRDERDLWIRYRLDRGQGSAFRKSLTWTNPVSDSLKRSGKR